MVSGSDRHLECVEDQVGGHRVRMLPADDPPGEDVDHESNECRPLPVRHVGEVRDPELVWPSRAETSVDQISGPLITVGRVSGPLPCRAPDNATDALTPHQTLDIAARIPMPSRFISCQSLSES